jgi:hypothetical protein
MSGDDALPLLPTCIPVAIDFHLPRGHPGTSFPEAVAYHLWRQGWHSGWLRIHEIILDAGEFVVEERSAIVIDDRHDPLPGHLADGLLHLPCSFPATPDEPAPDSVLDATLALRRDRLRRRITKDRDDRYSARASAFEAAERRYLRRLRAVIDQNSALRRDRRNKSLSYPSAAPGLGPDAADGMDLLLHREMQAEYQSLRAIILWRQWYNAHEAWTTRGPRIRERTATGAAIQWRLVRDWTETRIDE